MGPAGARRAASQDATTAAAVRRAGRSPVTLTVTRRQGRRRRRTTEHGRQRDVAALRAGRRRRHRRARDRAHASRATGSRTSSRTTCRSSSSTTRTSRWRYTPAAPTPTAAGCARGSTLRRARGGRVRRTADAAGDSRCRSSRSTDAHARLPAGRPAVGVGARARQRQPAAAIGLDDTARRWRSSARRRPSPTTATWRTRACSARGAGAPTPPTTRSSSRRSRPAGWPGSASIRDDVGHDSAHAAIAWARHRPRVPRLPPLVLPHRHGRRLRVPRAAAQAEAGRSDASAARHGRAGARQRRPADRRRRRSAASCGSAARCACRSSTLPQEINAESRRSTSWAEPFPHPFQTAPRHAGQPAGRPVAPTQRAAGSTETTMTRSSSRRSTAAGTPQIERLLTARPARRTSGRSWVERAQPRPALPRRRRLRHGSCRRTRRSYMEAAWQQVGKVLEGNQQDPLRPAARMATSTVWHRREPRCRCSGAAASSSWRSPRRCSRRVARRRAHRRHRVQREHACRGRVLGRRCGRRCGRARGSRSASASTRRAGTPDNLVDRRQQRRGRRRRRRRPSAGPADAATRSPTTLQPAVLAGLARRLAAPRCPWLRWLPLVDRSCSRCSCCCSARAARSSWHRRLRRPGGQLALRAGRRRSADCGRRTLSR